MAKQLIETSPMNKITCIACKSFCSLYDVIDLNKVAGETLAYFNGPSGTAVYYAYCDNCGHCFAPELCNWSQEEFAAKIYNESYPEIDPECVDVRPRQSHAKLVRYFGEGDHLPFSHLDYGGGNGLLSKLLCQSGWNSISYDPFLDSSPQKSGKFDLITAFEVFEHAPSIDNLISEIKELLTPNGVIYFSTAISDGNINPKERLKWWYAAPRNGHISLFSSKSLAVTAQKSNFNIASDGYSCHAFFTKLPDWAKKLIP